MFPSATRFSGTLTIQKKPKEKNTKGIERECVCVRIVRENGKESATQMKSSNEQQKQNKKGMGIHSARIVRETGEDIACCEDNCD
jgi:formate dehydrogenase assembly factor FdhD